MRRSPHIMGLGLTLALFCATGCEQRALPEVERDALEARMNAEQQALTEEREALDEEVTAALDEAAEEVRQAIERADDLDESTFTFED